MLKLKLRIFHYSRIYYEKFSNIAQRVQRQIHNILYKTERSHYFYIWISVLAALGLLGVSGVASSSVLHVILAHVAWVEVTTTLVIAGGVMSVPPEPTGWWFTVEEYRETSESVSVSAAL